MKIVITGDFCPINRAADVLERKDFLNDLGNLIEAADFRITNLECPLTKHPSPIEKTGPALKASPEQVRLLIESRFNLVTLANNHIMDYGSQGLKDTLKVLEQNKINFVGAGKVQDEIDVVYKIHDDIKIAIVNFCENEWSTLEREGYKANGFSEIEAFYSIRKAKKNADLLIVIHHGGQEMYNLPSPRLKKTLRYFVDCGADVVINHHTHCVSGHEIYNEKPIFYSIGNFTFDLPSERNSIWNYGAVVTLTLGKKSLDHAISYFEQFNEHAGIALINKDDLPYDIDEINNIIQDDNLLKDKFEIFVSKKVKMYNAYLEPIKSNYFNALKNRGFLPSLWSKRKRFYLQNLISCESHREIIQEILTRETNG